MGRLAFGTPLLVLWLASRVCLAATPGVTTAERGLATELNTRLTERRTADPKLALELARVYLRRAYLVDVDPARAVALELLAPALRLKEQEQLQYFALSLDALVRGAALGDITTMIREVLAASYLAADRDQFFRWFIGVASQHISPIPLLQLTKTATDNGMTGKRRRDFIAWVVAQVERGEDPAYIKRVYDAVRRVSPSFTFQIDFLAKCYDAVRIGASPAILADAVERMAMQHKLPKGLEEQLGKLLDLFNAGTPLEEAVQKVVPDAAK